MKQLNLIKLLSAAVILFITVGMALPMNAFAASGSGSVQFNGKGSEPWTIKSAPVFYTSTGDEIVDFFGTLTKELMPGDSRSFTVELKNTSNTKVMFWMRTCPVTRDGAKLDGLKSSGLTTLKASFTDKSPLNNDDLLDQITLKLTNPFSTSAGATLYSGTLRGDGTGINKETWTQLGYVNPGQSGYVGVSIDVPLSLSDYYQNSLAAVEWQFYTEYDDNPVISTPPSGGSKPSSPSETTLTTEISEPLLPEFPVLLEEDPPDETASDADFGEPKPPLADFVVQPPKTGDSQALGFWIAIACVGLTGFIFLNYISFRKEKKAA